MTTMILREAQRLSAILLEHSLIRPWLRPFRCGDGTDPLLQWNIEWILANGIMTRPKSVIVLHDWWKPKVLDDGNEERFSQKVNKNYVGCCSENRIYDATFTPLFHASWSECPIKRGDARVMNFLPGERTQACKSSTSKEMGKTEHVSALAYALPLLKLLNPCELIYLCGEWSWYVRKQVREAFPGFKVLCHCHPSDRQGGWRKHKWLKTYNDDDNLS
jgi:hypothetical protein